MKKILLILFALCAFACNSSGRPEPEPVAVKQVMPKDVFLQALQDAAVIIADSSASTPARLMELFTALGEKYFIKLNKPGGREPVDTSCLYVYIDSIMGNTCVLRILPTSQELRTNSIIEDLKRKFGSFKTEKKEYQQSAKLQIYPFVFTLTAKEVGSVCNIKVYPDHSMPKGGYKDFRINKIHFCYNLE